MIEVEIRSLITTAQFNHLLDFFHKEGKFLHEDYQETFYFDAPVDLRIQRNNFHSKIWLKKGKIHDAQREEIEIHFPREGFESLEKMFLVLGYNVAVKWFRKRHSFLWQGISVMLDDTKGYGLIIELEKMCDKKDEESVLQLLKQKLSELKIPLTPREEFEAKFQHYKDNWKELTN